MGENIVEFRSSELEIYAGIRYYLEYHGLVKNLKNHQKLLDMRQGRIREIGGGALERLS